MAAQLDDEGGLYLVIGLVCGILIIAVLVGVCCYLASKNKLRRGVWYYGYPNKDRLYNDRHMKPRSSYVYNYRETPVRRGNYPRAERYEERTTRRHSYSGRDTKPLCPIFGGGCTRRGSEGDLITTYPTTLESLEYRLGRSNKGHTFTGRQRLHYLLGRRFYGDPYFIFQTRHINDVSPGRGHSDYFDSFDKRHSDNERANDSGYSSDNARMRTVYSSTKLGRNEVNVNAISDAKGVNSPSYQAFAVQDYVQSPGDAIVPYSQHAIDRKSAGVVVVPYSQKTLHQKSASGRHFVVRRARRLVIRYKPTRRHPPQLTADKYGYMQYGQQSGGGPIVTEMGGAKVNTQKHALAEYKIVPYVSSDPEKSHPAENTGIHGTTSYFTTRENVNPQYQNRGKLPRHERDHVLYHGFGKTTDVFCEVPSLPHTAHI